MSGIQRILLLFLKQRTGSKTMTAFPGSSDIDETEKSMKRVTALLLLLTLLLCACSKEAVYTFEKDGTLTDKSGNAYYSAPVGYEPTNQGDKYGKIDDAIGETLYQVGDLDPEDYLTGEYSGGATSFFLQRRYRSSGIMGNESVFVLFVPAGNQYNHGLYHWRRIPKRQRRFGQKSD